MAETAELVKTTDIAQMVGNTVTVKTIRDRWTKAETFPKPVRLPVPTRAKHWRRADVERWIRDFGSPELAG